MNTASRCVLLVVILPTFQIVIHIYIFQQVEKPYIFQPAKKTVYFSTPKKSDKKKLLITSLHPVDKLFIKACERENFNVTALTLK